MSSGTQAPVEQQQQDLATNQQQQQQQPLQQIQQQTSSTHNSLSSGSSSNHQSPSNSISLIKLDELSSFGATKQSRLPALIKITDQSQQERQTNSMPAMNVDEVEKSPAQQATSKQQASLPVQVGSQQANEEGKENSAAELDSGDFQMVDMSSAEAALLGPSLPQPQQSEQPELVANQQATDKHHPMETSTNSTSGRTVIPNNQEAAQRAALASSLQYNQPPSQLGDSLIDMVINLRNENQNLVRALETNNDYVKERLSEFKRLNDEAKRREAQFAMEKAEHEHQVRKLQRQNLVLSERLKSMEAKLKDMKLEISDSLAAANSSKTSSVRADADAAQLYPQLGEPESFANAALANQATTIQMDATSGELYHGQDEDKHDSLSSTTSSSSSSSGDPLPGVRPSAPLLDTMDASVGQQTAAKVSDMSKEELSKRFDADKAEFYAMDDPMKQCDKLEKQLNDIGKRDYEICLLQQQLNIYRQDYRLERMAHMEAKIQIERLKNDIDRLCLDRLNHRQGKHHRHRAHLETATDTVGKLGHHLSRRASKAAAKAARYSAKQAHREEKAAAYAAAAASSASTSAQQQPAEQEQHHRHHRRANSHLRGLRAVKNEVVSDLMSTANKAMLTGYKMASTHVNLALDKLSQFEQAQAANLAQNRQQQESKPSGPPSVD